MIVLKVEGLCLLAPLFCCCFEVRWSDVGDQIDLQRDVTESNTLLLEVLSSFWKALDIRQNDTGV